MRNFNFGRKGGYRAKVVPPTFESIIGRREPKRTCPMLAEQVIQDMAGMPAKILEQYCVDIGATVSYSEYWGHRRYCFADRSVLVVPKVFGDPVAVDGSDTESIRRYCESLRYDSREVNFFMSV